MSTETGELEAAALNAMRTAYAAYSEFPVGAALEAEDGSVYLGCNVENASFPVTICAERVALGAAVVNGARNFRRLAVATRGPVAAPPCGMCRQALAEFGLELEVLSVTPQGERSRWTLGELLPASFRLDPHTHIASVE